METVRVRATYRYASDAARDAAIAAALGVMADLRCAFTLSRELVVDVDVPLFGARDFALFEVLALYSCDSQKSRG